MSESLRQVDIRNCSCSILPFSSVMIDSGHERDCHKTGQD